MQIETSRQPGRVWILTDARYLAQRMPLALAGCLRAEGADVRLLVADGLVAAADPRSPDEDPWHRLAAGDVVVARTRNRFALALLRAAARPGVAVLTPWAAVAAVRNKPRAAQALAAAGVPAPPTVLADSPASLKRLPSERFPLLLKPHLGDNARGIVLVRTAAELDDLPWTDGMVLAQTYVDAGAVDLKLYAAGDRVWAVRRPSPLAEGGAEAAERVEPSEAHRRLVHACARTFGLSLLGVDVLETRGGPLVVDVNDFPNYTGVAEAPGAIAALVEAALAQGVALA